MRACVFVSVFIYIYIYIYIYMCVCVCVRERERERAIEQEDHKKKHTHTHRVTACSVHNLHLAYGIQIVWPHVTDRNLDTIARLKALYVK